MMDRLGDDRAWRLDRQEERIRALEDDLAVAIDRIAELETEDSALHTRCSKGDNKATELENTATGHRRHIYILEEQVNRLTRSLSDLMDKVSDHIAVGHTAPPHDFPVTSAGEAKPMKRWVITTAETGSRFSRWKGMIRPRSDVEAPSFFEATSFFETQEEAEAIRKALFPDIEWLYVGEVEVVERYGMLVEARHA